MLKNKIVAEKTELTKSIALKAAQTKAYIKDVRISNSQMQTEKENFFEQEPEMLHRVEDQLITAQDQAERLPAWKSEPANNE